MKNEKFAHRVSTLIILLSYSFIFFSCGNNEDVTPAEKKQFGVFLVTNETTVELNGTINSSSLTNFHALIEAHPTISQVNIVNCDGSSDDEVNLQLSKRVNDKGMSIHLNDNGLIASGGTDFFLAGVKRTKGVNTRIGVHSWAGEDNSGNMVSATDFPVGHEFHLPYINYYVSVGFTQQQAEDFYYFTINAATADDIHWMTDAEIDQYEILTD